MSNRCSIHFSTNHLKNLNRARARKGPPTTSSHFQTGFIASIVAKTFCSSFVVSGSSSNRNPLDLIEHGCRFQPPPGRAGDFALPLAQKKDNAPQSRACPAGRSLAGVLGHPLPDAHLVEPSIDAPDVDVDVISRLAPRFPIPYLVPEQVLDDALQALLDFFIHGVGGAAT